MDCMDRGYPPRATVESKPEPTTPAPADGTSALPADEHARCGDEASGSPQHIPWHQLLPPEIFVGELLQSSTVREHATRECESASAEQDGVPLTNEVQDVAGMDGAPFSPSSEMVASPEHQEQTFRGEPSAAAARRDVDPPNLGLQTAPAV